MVYATEYFWVVLCKNHRFHRKGNTSYAHQIALAETDTYSAPPVLKEPLLVRCDACGQEYTYKAGELLRNEIEVPEKFVPHPEFGSQTAHARREQS